MGCPNYFAYVYLHLAAASAIAAASATSLHLTAGFYEMMALIVGTFVSLIAIAMAAPGSLLQYLFFVVFAILIGQTTQTFYQKDLEQNSLTRVLVLLGGIFAAMTALGFYDRQNLLGFGPYLFAGLLGLIVAEIGYDIYVYNGGEDKTSLSYIMDFGIVLFTVFIAYDTQRLKQKEKVCSMPNYPWDSLSLFLDLANLFQLLSRK
jgi:FtsH-binding integral membrane protein